MVYILSLIITCIICSLYVSGQKYLALVGLFLSATSVLELNANVVGLDYLMMGIIGNNAFFFSISFLLIRQFKKNNIVFWKGYNALERFAIVIFIYAGIIAVFTWISGKESLFNLIALMKPYTILLTIFLFRDINYRLGERLVGTVFSLCTFVGIIALFQAPFNFYVFGHEIDSDSGGNLRFWSPYSIATFCLMLTVVLLRKKKYTYLLFFLVLVIMPMRRGLIISSSLTIALYYLFLIRRHKLPKGIFAIIFAGLLAMPILSARFSQDGDSASSDISNVLSGQVDYENFRTTGGGGTFLFRMSILFERIDYLVQNPRYLLTGVGMLHEDTAQKEFSFFLGSYKTINGERIPQQIDTTDLVWPPILMRLGVIGLILYSLLFVYLLRFFKHNIYKTPWAMVGLTYVFNFLVFSFADAELNQYYSLFLYFVIYRLTEISANNKEKMSNRYSLQY